MQFSYFKDILFITSPVNSDDKDPDSAKSKTNPGPKSPIRELKALTRDEIDMTSAELEAAIKKMRLTTLQFTNYFLQPTHLEVMESLFRNKQINKVIFSGFYDARLLYFAYDYGTFTECQFSLHNFDKQQEGRDLKAMASLMGKRGLKKLCLFSLNAPACRYKHLFSYLKYATELQSLALPGNPLIFENERHLKKLNTFLQNNRVLNELVLIGNELTFTKIMPLFFDLEGDLVTRLARLDLSYNEMGKNLDEIARIIYFILHNASLRELNLRGCAFTNEMGLMLLDGYHIVREKALGIKQAKTLRLNIQGCFSTEVENRYRIAFGNRLIFDGPKPPASSPIPATKVDAKLESSSLTSYNSSPVFTPNEDDDSDWSNEIDETPPSPPIDWSLGRGDAKSIPPAASSCSIESTTSSSTSTTPIPTLDNATPMPNAGAPSTPLPVLNFGYRDYSSSVANESYTQSRESAANEGSTPSTESSVNDANPVQTVHQVTLNL